MSKHSSWRHDRGYFPRIAIASIIAFAVVVVLLGGIIVSYRWWWFEEEVEQRFVLEGEAGADYLWSTRAKREGTVRPRAIFPVPGRGQ